MQTHSRAVWKPRVNPLGFLSTNSYRISGLDQEPVNPPTAGNTTLSPVQVEKAACGGVPVSRGWFLDVGRPTWCEWEQPPSSILLLLTCCSGCPRWVPHTMEPLGAATGIHPKKTHQESPFPPSPKGEGRKSVQGCKRSWAMVVAALTRPIPKFHQNPGHHCSVGSRGAAKLTVATAPMRNRAKQQGKKTFTSDRCLHLISREHRELPPE